MRQLGRAGLTLVELMISLVLCGIIGVVTARVFVSNLRWFRQLTERIDVAGNLRAASSVLVSELRLLDAREGDILAMARDSIKIRALRQLAFICSPPTVSGSFNENALTVRGAGPGDSMFFGPRSFNAATDSLFIYAGDSWLAARLTDVGPAACPDGRAGQRLTVDLPAVEPLQSSVDGGIAAGSPVWGFEYNVVYRSYQAADSKWYLGMRNGGGGGGGIQPIAGPVDGPNGLSLLYYDSGGMVTTVPDDVAQIEIRVVARASSGNRDSVTSRVSLRNNLRRPGGS